MGNNNSNLSVIEEKKPDMSSNNNNVFKKLHPDDEYEPTEVWESIKDERVCVKIKRNNLLRTGPIEYFNCFLGEDNNNNNEDEDNDNNDDNNEDNDNNNNEDEEKGYLRCVCLSDTHSLHTKFKPSDIPKGDILLHAGDFSNIGLLQDITSLNDFLKKLDFKYKVVIAGNHDLSFEKGFEEEHFNRFHATRGVSEPIDSDYAKSLLQDVIYLEDESVNIEGINIYGSPYTPWFFDWAYNLPRNKLSEDKWKQIPTDTDILLTHGPPLGYGDRCSEGQRAGCYHLLKEIESRVKPQFHIFGHIHEGYGVTTNKTTKFINASNCTYRYKLLNPIIVFDIKKPESSKSSD